MLSKCIYFLTAAAGRSSGLRVSITRDIPPLPVDLYPDAESFSGASALSCTSVVLIPDLLSVT